MSESTMVKRPPPRPAARYAVPVGIGAALVSVAAAGFAAGYELISVAGGRSARHHPPSDPLVMINAARRPATRWRQ